MVEQWLTDHVYNYDELRTNTKKAIYNFSLVWSFFECYIFDTTFSISKIQKKLNGLNDQRLSILDHEYNYFRNRYISNETINSLFEDLKFRANDKKDFVADCLINVETTNKDKTEALIIIIYRLRNNLFHGVKWDTNLNDQIDNFNFSCSTLIKLIENV